MNILLDTQLLIWGAMQNPKLSRKAAEAIGDEDNTIWFSVASLWEIAIKSALKRKDFPYDAGTMRAGLLANHYLELSVEGRHVLALGDLPLLHRDPFDRMLVAQASSEGMLLMTADRLLEDYGKPILLV